MAFQFLFAADPRGQRRTIFLAGRLARLKPAIAGASRNARLVHSAGWRQLLEPEGADPAFGGAGWLGWRHVAATLTVFVCGKKSFP